jgi:hypothetical protein
VTNQQSQGALCKNGTSNFSYNTKEIHSEH